MRAPESLEGDFEFMEEGEVAEEPSEFKGMDDTELASLIGQELQNTSSILSGGTIAAEREKAINYYYGREFGNEVDGKSQIVLADVAETIDWVMPSLVRMFTGGRETVRYEPTGQGDEPGADQASDVINKKFVTKWNGERLIHDLLKTCLMEKVAPGYVTVEQQQKLEVVEYHGLTVEQLTELLAEDGVEPIEHTAREVELEPPGAPAGAPKVSIQLHDVRVKRVTSKREIKIGPIPPEEFFITRRYADIDDETPFCGRRFKRSVSTLVGMGLPRALVEQLQADDPIETDTSRITRFLDEEDGPPADITREDSGRMVWVTECFIRADVDGDGIAELRKVIMGGSGETSQILFNDYAEDIDYFAICPYPMPFKFWGRSLADIVAPLQLIRSTIMRMILDYLYLTVNPQKVVREGSVDIDSLLLAKAGGNIIAFDSVDDVKPLLQPSMSPAVFSTMEMLTGERENRAGVTRYNQGLDASSLNQTASGISQIMEASAARIELIARCLVPGLRRMFKLILKKQKQHGMMEESIRIRDRWVNVDPSTWNVDMDVAIQVGLGVGQARERIANLNQIIQTQVLASDKFGDLLVTPKQGYAALQELTEAMGFPIEGKFFKNPGEEMPPPPPPDPKLLQAEADGKKSEFDARLAEQRFHLDVQKFQADEAFRRYECEKKTEVDLARLAANERVEFAKIQSTEQIEKQRIAAQTEAAEEKGEPEGGE